MKPILRQLSVSMTPEGGIGLGNNLLFKNKKDLALFKDYTKKTIMIAGFNTAQQMLDLKVDITRQRPMIVISRGRHVQTLLEANHEYILYAADLRKAIELADHLIAQREVNCVGWTICGGLKTYEDAILDIKAGTLKLNSAYVFTADTGSFVVDHVLSVDAAEFLNVVRSSMRLPEDQQYTAGFYLKDSAGVEQRCDCTVHKIFDSYTFDVAGIHISDDWTISVADSVSKKRTTICIGSISSYEIEESRDVLSITWHSGHKTDLRIASTTPRAGINYLELLLDKVIG